jgi:hypothetical protein
MAETEISTELMEMMCEKMQRMKEGSDTLFPIKKIKGLNVRVILSKRAEDWYTLNIEPLDIVLNNCNIFTCDWKQENYWQRVTENEFIRDISETILVVLKTLKIDKLNGTFITQKMIDEKQKTDEDDQLWSRFCYDFELDKNFVLDYYDCEMCFKSTKMRIDCGHSLCLECLIHLEIMNDSCEHYYYRQCPLCHQHIHSLMK